MIIGIMGQARSGKDTFADYVVAKHGFVRIALADPIKRICMDIYNMTEDQLWGDDKEKPDLRYPIEGRDFMSPRVACQVIGTEVGRNLYTNTWVDYFKNIAQDVMEDKYCYSRTEGRVARGPLIPSIGYGKDGFTFNRPAATPKGVVCPDIRFKNEVKAVQDMGGLVVRLVRAGKSGDVGLKGHASEEEQKAIKDSELGGVIQVPEGIDRYHEVIEQFMARVTAVRNILTAADGGVK